MIRFEPGCAPLDITVDSVVIITQAGHPYYGETVVVVRRGHADPAEGVVRHADGRHWAITAAGVAGVSASTLPPPAVLTPPPLLDLARLRQIVHLVAALPPPATPGPPELVACPPQRSGRGAPVARRSSSAPDTPTT